MQRHIWLWLTLCFSGLFVLSSQFTSLGSSRKQSIEDRVVISAPIQLLLSGGDRFLAADLEVIRSAASGADGSEADALYRIRTHRAAAQLNPCHEDNYYLGSALLSWGGAVDDGRDLLRRATVCRQWDEIPPFLYGFMQLYFYRDSAEAIRSFETAAQRSPQNYAALKKIVIMITAGQFNDDHMALDYLEHQYEQASDLKLRQMLEKRLERLKGLITLREAQAQFEKGFNRALKSPQELLDNGLLERFPADPLGLGYEFRENKFMLRQLKIAGME